MAKGKYSDNIPSYSVRPSQVNADDPAAALMDGAQASKVTTVVVLRPKRFSVCYSDRYLGSNAGNENVILWPAHFCNLLGR